MRALARALDGQEAVDLVEAPLRALSMPEELRNEILGAPVPLESYESMAPEQVLAKASEELWERPFADCGSIRTYRWRALGISWTVRCENTLNHIPFAEEFVAVLQIAIADIARSDLCLLPTSVELEVAATDVADIELVESPDNNRLAYRVEIPKSRNSTPGDLERVQSGVLAITTSLLVWCSCLSDSEIDRRLRQVYREGLSSKAFLVRSYSELFIEFCSRATFETRRIRPIAVELTKYFSQRQALELGWRDAPGPGYTKAKSHLFIRNRYRLGLLPVAITLSRLRQSMAFQDWVTARRQEALLDWQILIIIANAVANFRAPVLSGANLERDTEALRTLINREERADDVPFPEEQLYSDLALKTNVALAATAKTWGLTVRSRTPDFTALKQLLDIRYRQSSDDIPHEDLFAPLT